MMTPVATPTRMAIGAVSGWFSPRPNHSGVTSVCVMAIMAEHVASREPTLRSMFRVTITKTMPVAMIATETV